MDKIKRLMVLLIIASLSGFISCGNASSDIDGNTSLMIAAAKSERRMVKTYLAFGADVNGTNRYGMTALMRAAECRDPEIVKDLLAKGANVNIKASGGWNAVMAAA